ncbi:MAG: tRNA (adenosine(37)-N6)-threonylcarbamoyltransferase complex ATPase subunit type 1 TsaE [Candidatus Spechtbacterales bacterium]
MTKSKYTSTSPEETKNIAKDLIKDLYTKEGRNHALVFALEGELGAGKTNFTQGIAEFLGIERNVTSPTFVLVKKYNIADKVSGDKSARFYHLDCYRTQSPQEIMELDWEDVVREKDNVVIVEWAEKIKDIIPKDAVWVTMKSRGENEREIVVSV